MKFISMLTSQLRRIKILITTGTWPISEPVTGTLTNATVNVKEVHQPIIIEVPNELIRPLYEAFDKRNAYNGSFVVKLDFRTFLATYWPETVGKNWELDNSDIFHPKLVELVDE